MTVGELIDQLRILEEAMPVKVEGYAQGGPVLATPTLKVRKEFPYGQSGEPVDVLVIG